MNWRPLWTAKVSPIISGVIVERRLHVLMTRLLPVSRASRTFLSRCPSTNGPFFTLRDMGSSLDYLEYRRFTMKRVEAFLLSRVRRPLVGLPHGVTGWQPLALP